MKKTAQLACLMFVGLAMLWPTPMVMAEEKAASKPATIGVVSVAAYDSLVEDLTLLGSLSGNGKLVRQIQEKLKPVVAAIDTTKPSGSIIRVVGEDVQIIGFGAVTDMDKLIKGAKEAGIKIKSVDDHYEVEMPQGKTFQIRYRDGWVFTAEKLDQLTDLPKDPSKMLGDLPTQYLVAGRLDVQRVPEVLRKKVAGELGGLIGALRGGQAGGEDEVAAHAEAIKQVDHVTVGWAVDPKEKSTYVDVAIKAVAGTEFATQMKGHAKVKSSFAGLVLPGAAFTLHFASDLSDQEKAAAAAALAAARKQLLKGLIENLNLATDEDSAEAAALFGELLDSLQAIFKEGKLDGGIAVVLKPRAMTIVGGGQVADSEKLGATFKKFVKMARRLDGKFPGVKFDAEKYGDVTFHTMSVPIKKDDRAAKVFGESVDVAVGLGKKSFYVAVGKDTLSTIKQVIDDSKKRSEETVPPLQTALSVGSVVRFVASVEENNFALAAISLMLASAKDKDHIRLTAEPIDLGLRYRLQLERGIIALIGQAGKLARAGF
jgi:hypothetical protein